MARSEGRVRYRTVFKRRPRLPDGFDAQQYLDANPDVAASGMDAATHYLQSGRHEGRPLHVKFTGSTPTPGMETSARLRLTRHLVGAGLELGPGHHPWVTPFTGVSVAYVDRWEPTSNQVLFPELGADATFPMPDIRAHFDVDGLGPIDDGSQDFVIASHVLEHLANPLRFLDEIHRVLRPGGLFLFFLPDKRRTFDADRRTTPLEHLIQEYRTGVNEVDDDHIVEFLLSTSPHELPVSENAWPDVIRRHRQRSVHVHCWTEHDFPAVVRYAISTLGQRWEVVDIATLADGGPGSFEFGYLLRRSTTDIHADVLAARFDELAAAIAGYRTSAVE